MTDPLLDVALALVVLVVAGAFGLAAAWVVPLRGRPRCPTCGYRAHPGDPEGIECWQFHRQMGQRPRRWHLHL